MIVSQIIRQADESKNNYLRIVPFLVLHSSAVALIQPLPLQLFCPAQAVVAVAQRLVPLQELMPEHLTVATFASSATATEVVVTPASNKVAAADANVTPDNFLTEFILMIL